MSAQIRHRIRWSLSLWICCARERFDLSRALEELLLAEVEEDVDAARREVHSVHRETSGIRQEVYALQHENIRQRDLSRRVASRNGDNVRNLRTTYG